MSTLLRAFLFRNPSLSSAQQSIFTNVGGLQEAAVPVLPGVG